MKRVLVIDDSPEIRQAAGAALTRAGFDVVEATDGVLAIAALAALTPLDPPIAAVLCGLALPRLGGVAVVHALRADPRWRAVPVVMLAPDGAPELLAQATLAGARGFIRTPFDDRLLVTALQQLIA